MRSARTLLAALLLAVAPIAANGAAAAADDRPTGATRVASIGTTGRGIGVVFSPDLSTPGTRAFYEALGFACFETGDWCEVVEGVAAWNADPLRVPIATLVIESHGTNGHGLKVQVSKSAEDARSYISVGALQEAAARAGVGEIILSACNSGRLLRPEIYHRLDRDPGDPLFLPATRGVIDASGSFDPDGSPVDVMRRAESFLETLAVASYRELPPCVREASGFSESGAEFVISTMLIQLLTDDARLELIPAKATNELSRREFRPAEIEALVQRFFRFLESRCETPPPLRPRFE